MKNSRIGVDVLGMNISGTPPLVDCVARGRLFMGYVEPTGSVLTMPGAILGEMNKVLNEGKTLDLDISNFKSSDSTYASFQTGWKTFWQGYLSFYDDNSGWFSRLWNSTLTETVDYGRQLNDWRAKYSSYPGAVATQPKPTPTLKPDDPNSIPWKWIIIGTVAVAGLAGTGYAVSKIMSAFPRTT